MITLPLYPEAPRLRLQDEEPLVLDRNCMRCKLSAVKGLRSICMGAEGKPEQTGGLLVISDYPGKREDQRGRPFVGVSGDFMRQILDTHWKGPVTLDNAMRCAPGDDDQLEAPMAQCRPYLAATLRESKPDRIVLMGKWAFQSVLGRNMQPFQVRKGYTWMKDGERRVPVFFLMNPAAAMRNRFVRGWFQEDFRWALTHSPPPPPWDGVAKLVRTAEDAEQAERELRAAEWISYDVETAGVQWRTFQVVSASCTVKGSDDAWVWEAAALRDPATLAPLQRLLADPNVKKVGANVKYDQHSTTLGLGVELRGVIGDVRLKRKLIDAEADADLGTMAELVGMGGHKAEAHAALKDARKRVKQILKDRSSKQLLLVPEDYGDVRRDVVKDIRETDDPDAFAFGFLPAALRARYNARDTVSTARLDVHLDATLAANPPQLRRTLDTIVHPASLAVQQVEAWGVAVDQRAVDLFHHYLAERQAEARAKLSAYGEFNPDSPKDIGRLLYDDLGMPSLNTTASGGRSTDADTLETLALAHPHPILSALLEYRRLGKLDGTYALGMQRHIRADGRIHPSLLLDGARSGRMSCADPNLQNIPRDADTAEGRMARSIFMAPPGYELMSFDYNQLELRIAAMLSEDEEMIDIFRRGVDFHQATAEFIAPIVWKIKPEDVKKPQRTAAKAFNFGIIYGMSDPGIAQRAGCTTDVAAKIREAVLGRFRKFGAWINEQLAAARRTGFTWTWWDGFDARRRPLWRIADEDGEDRSKAEHSSWNTRIQGTGSDYCLMSLVEVVRWILSDGVDAKLILPIHDALLLEVAKPDMPEVAHTVREIMTGWNSKGVPLGVDVERGPNWGSLEKFKEAA